MHVNNMGQICIILNILYANEPYIIAKSTVLMKKILF